MRAKRRRLRRGLAGAIAWLLFAAGAGLAVVGVLLDSLSAGSSPGLSLPQMLVIAGGAGLALFGWRLRREEFRRRMLRELRAQAAKIAIVTVITLLALEVALTLAGMETTFNSDLPQNDAVSLNLRICGAGGCAYDYHRVQALCQQGILLERFCAINQAGYRDDDAFVAPDADISRRVLLLGDSFTQGFNADLGLSFPARLDKLLPDALMWNTGITGNGTNSALAAFQAWAPILEPQITILAFFAGNDFLDNQYPPDVWVRALRKDGTQKPARRYAIDRLGNPVKLDIDTALRFHLNRQAAPTSAVELALGSTRLGTLFLRFLDTSARVFVGWEHGMHPDVTRGYLRQLRDEAAQQGSALLTVIVPSKKDMQALTDEYTTARKLLGELGMPYLELVDRLSLETDYPSDDPHWNNAGHGKVAEILSACIKAFYREGSLTACEGTTAP